MVQMLSKNLIKIKVMLYHPYKVVYISLNVVVNFNILLAIISLAVLVSEFIFLFKFFIKLTWFL
jgi:hypothetical protein